MRRALVAATMVLRAVTASRTQRDSGNIEGVVTVRHEGSPRDASGVVLYVVGFEEPPPPERAQMRQHGRHFIPALLPVTAGQSVSFPNGDPFLHNVFSPSPTRPFDLGQYAEGETKTKRFPTVGVVDVYCNIHPEMSATLVILPNTRYAIADAQGRFEIAHLPPGSWTVFAFSRRAARPVSTRVTVAADGIVEIALELDELPRDFAHPNKYGEKYRPTTVYPPGA